MQSEDAARELPGFQLPMRDEIRSNVPPGIVEIAGIPGAFPPSGTCLQPDPSLSRTTQWGESDDQT